ncbi:MAG: tetratricopeptide repeat protein [Syntrophomonas sp.]
MVIVADFAHSYELAEACYKSGDYEQARHYFESALALSNPQDERTASLYWEYTLFLYRTGECATAFSKVKQGLAQYPDCRELYNIQGQIYYELGLLEQSRINFLKCIALKASYKGYIDDENLAEHKPYCFLTAIAALQGKSAEMLHYLQLLAEKNPSFLALQKLCLMLLHLGMETQPLIDILGIVYGISSPALSCLLLMIEEHKACLEALNQFNEKAELKFNDCAALGEQFFNRACFGLPKVVQEKSLTREGSTPQAYCMLGLVCSRSGMYDKALEYFLHAMNLDKDNQVYSCLVFEVLAVHSAKILLQWSNSFWESPAFINELLRLCTIKRKAKLIRQQIVAQENDLKRIGGIKIHGSILSPEDDINEEDVWQINV